MQHEMPTTNLQRAALASCYRVGMAAGLAGAVSLLAACGSLPGTRAAAGGSQVQPLYRCDNNIEFTARFVDDSVLLDSTRGYEVLYRDAGGVTEQQRFFSNPKMKAEFGLGQTGREAVLRYPSLPLVARCVRD